MFGKRGRYFLFFFILLGGITSYCLYDRMIARREEILNTRYTEKRVVELIEKLIGEQVFKIEGEKVVLDEMALSTKHLGKKTEMRARNSLPFLYVKKGEILLDRMAFSITSDAALREETGIRGRFLDRNGIVLARSVLNGNERISNQKREYTYGPEFYPIVGHSTPVFGKRNLEKELDPYLTGKYHFPVRRKLPDALNAFEIGDDVILTLDSKIQRLAYNLMKDKRGAVVVLDVKTGGVLCAVSTPSFDPNIKEASKWREAFKDNDERPYENRAFSVLYPPGSTFKTIVASAWLEDDDAEKDYEIICTGKKNKYKVADIHAHGKVDFNKAFIESCNLFVSEIGVTLGQKLLDYANKFGFNRDLDLLPRLKNHHYKCQKSLAFSWKEYNSGQNETKVYKGIDFKRNPKIVAQGSIGQNLIAATPLQMALVASTVANRGMLMNPFLVKEIKTGDGKKILFSSQPVETGRSLKDTTTEKLRKLMVDVMERGTGKDVKKIYFEEGKYTTSTGDNNLKVIPVAGKTGTAEVGDKNGNGSIDSDEKPHSWFVGFAPADNPEVAIAVVAENQGFGSLTAAPIGVDVLAEALNR